jgi:hypothetical protein
VKVLVCGGRDYGNSERVAEILDTLLPFTLICGMARGADTLAFNYARAHDYPILEFPADWKQHGRSAGPLRNKQMLDEGCPDLVIAFPGGAGTANMVLQAKRAKVEVWRDPA